jgi:5-methylcytosine-specific restriction endonuclease McrA
MEKIIKKECKVHGETDFVLRSDKRYRCKKCSMDAVIKRRKLLKVKSVEYKGGECQVCGYKRCTDALEFHHLNPDEKDFGLSVSGNTRSWEKIKKELDKCILLCSNCHREVHNGLIILSP